jgi:site-specific DNA-methyltransferase (adenine-specific)
MTRNIHYSTPTWLAQQLVEDYGITIDACATQESAVCARFWGPVEDGLRQSWAEEIPFWNPPFDDVGSWVRKAYNELKGGVTSVGLVPFRKDQYWFDLALANAQLRLVRGGFLYFAGFDEQAGQVAKIDAVIFVFGPRYAGHTTGPLIVPPWTPDTARRKVSGVRLAAAPAKPEGTMVVQRYADLLPYVDAFARGEIRCLVMLGAPGLSKSTTIRARMPKSTCWIKGNASPFKAYVNLFRAIDAPIVLDDVESLLRKAGGVDLLKQLGDSDETKTVSWETDSSTLKRLKVPNEFQTTSRLCFIGNDWLRLNSGIAALEDRAIVVSFEPTAAEVHDRIGREGWFKDREIFEFVDRHLHLIMRPSMRHYVKAKEMKVAHLDWKTYLLTQWLADEKLIRTATLLADDTFSSNRARAQAFAARGWGSIASFYGKARELRSHQRPAGVIQDSNGLRVVPAMNGK